jgi:hypothetical protein
MKQHITPSAAIAALFTDSALLFNERATRRRCAWQGVTDGRVYNDYAKSRR